MLSRDEKKRKEIEKIKKARKDSRLIDVGMEDLAHESDGRRFVGISLRKFDTDPPLSSLIRTFSSLDGEQQRRDDSGERDKTGIHTLWRSRKDNDELVVAVANHVDLIVAHHPFFFFFFFFCHDDEARNTHRDRGSRD